MRKGRLDLVFFVTLFSQAVQAVHLWSALEAIPSSKQKQLGWCEKHNIWLLHSRNLIKSSLSFNIKIGPREALNKGQGLENTLAVKCQRRPRLVQVLGLFLW